MGDTLYVRSCQYCGQGFDSTDKDASESARDAHEMRCHLNPAVSN
jgi:hypothetical protein